MFGAIYIYIFHLNEELELPIQQAFNFYEVSDLSGWTARPGCSGPKIISKRICDDRRLSNGATNL